MPLINVGVSPDEVVLGYPLVKPGRVPCTITKAEIKDSKSGKPMCEFGLTPIGPVACTVTDDSGNQKDITSEGKELLRYYASFSPEALKAGALKRIQVACKTPGLGWRDGAIITEEFPQFIGKTVIANVTHHTGENGRTNANVDAVYAM